MADLKLHPWEPEETVGTLWHRFVTGLSELPTYPDEAVTLADMQRRIATVYRGLGGARGTQIAEAIADVTSHRRGFWRRVSYAEEKFETASFDGETLSLPASISCFDARALNEALYVWLAAYAAFDDGMVPSAADPLQFDLLRLRRVAVTTERILKACPGLAGTHRRLCAAALQIRQPRKLPPAEAAVETLIRQMLGDNLELEAETAAQWTSLMDTGLLPAGIGAPGGYKSFEPVVLWPERLALPQLSRGAKPGQDGAGGAATEGDDRRRRAARHKSDQANRRDSLILHRFETILSWTDFLNLNRRVEDDDEANARKAADDANEMAMTDIDQRPATRLAFDLDLAPHDVDREVLSGEQTYPEWDYRSGAYNRDHARVLFSQVEAVDAAELPPKSAEMRRRLGAVRRQFEALRPKRAVLARQADGDELDIDAVVESQMDLRASGHGSNRVYRRIADQQRDLSVATLIDTSRSTESAVHDRAVIDIARESLLALGYGLAATGDDHAIYSFSSLRRDRVFVNRVKTFGETMGPAVEARIAALRPGFYTRLGTAVRHVTDELRAVQSSRRLMLVITDGKPNDLDHYEGRYGIEDSRKAVLEARRSDIAVFGIAIDRKAERYIPYLFGQNGFAIISEPAKLVGALPLIYRHLVT